MNNSQRSIVAHRSSASAEDAQELQTWQAILADARFGFWRAVSVVGERFLVESGKRWAKRSLIAWLSFYALPAMGAIAYGLSTQSSLPAIVGGLIAGGVIVTELLIFVLCVILWPKLVDRAIALRRPPLLEELPQRRQALTLLEQRQHQPSPSIKRALRHGFGPGIVIVAPLAFLSAGLWLFNVFSASGLFPLNLAISLVGSVLIFGAFFIAGLLIFSGGGLVVVGKQALEHRSSTKLLHTSGESERLGALALVQERPDDAGALSLAQEAGAITEAAPDER